MLDKLLRIGVGLLIGVWTARYLGPEQFGLLNFAVAFTGLFGAFTCSGLQGIVVRDIVRNPEGAELTLGSAAMIQITGGIVAFLLVLSTIFYVRHEDSLTCSVVIIVGSMLLFKAGDIAAYWFEAKVQSKYTVLVQNGVFIFFAAIKIMLIWEGLGIIYFACIMAIEAAAMAVFLMAMLGYKGIKLDRLNASFDRVKELLKDGGPLIVSGFAIMIYMKIDQVMLGQILGDESVGIYSAAIKISEVWYFIPIVVASSVFPMMIEAKKRSDIEYRVRLQQLCDLLTWLSIAVALPVSFFGSYIVTALFGNAYIEAGPVLAIHIWTSIFVFLGVASGNWFLIENLQKMLLLRTLLGAMVNVVLNFLLIPIFSTIGAAIATLLAAIFVNFIVDFGSEKTRVIFFIKAKSFYFPRIGRLYLLRRWL